MEPMTPEPQGFHLPPPPASPPPFGPSGGGFAPMGAPMGGPPMGGPPMYTPPPRPQRAGLAVAALICGIVGVFTFWLLGVVPILATIFGLISAGTIKKSQGLRTGLGMARAGWVLGVLGIIGFGVFAWAAVTDRIGGDDDTVAVNDLDVGDCMAELPGVGTVFEVERVDCDLPHAGEVYFAGQLDPDRARSFPGDTVVSEEVAASCLAEFTSFVGTPYNESVFEVQYLQTNEIGWKATRGGYTCLVFEPGADVTGTVRNANR